MKYYKYHPFPELPKPLPNNDLAFLTSKSYAKFVDIDIYYLYELIMGAAYLDILPLVNLVAAKMAIILRLNTMEENRELFNVGNEFTPEEIQEKKEKLKSIEQLLP